MDVLKSMLTLANFVEANTTLSVHRHTHLCWYMHTLKLISYDAILLTMVRPGCIPARIASVCVAVNWIVFLEKIQVTVCVIKA